MRPYKYRGSKSENLWPSNYCTLTTSMKLQNSLRPCHRPVGLTSMLLGVVIRAGFADFNLPPWCSWLLALVGPSATPVGQVPAAPRSWPRHRVSFNSQTRKGPLGLKASFRPDTPQVCLFVLHSTSRELLWDWSWQLRDSESDRDWYVCRIIANLYKR